MKERKQQRNIKIGEVVRRDIKQKRDSTVSSVDAHCIKYVRIRIRNFESEYQI